MGYKTKYSWIVERISDNYILGAFGSKFKALEAISRWSEDGMYEVPDLGKQMPMDDQPCFVRAFSTNKKDNKGNCLIFIHKALLDNGAGLMFVFDNHEY